MARRRKVKVRITTWLDRDVLMWLKVRSLETRMGYQTLLNRMLQEAIAQIAKGRSEDSLVSRKEYESVLMTLKDLETRLGDLKDSVESVRSSSSAPSRRSASPKTKRTRKKPVKGGRVRPQDQRRPSQNSVP